MSSRSFSVVSVVAAVTLVLVGVVDWAINYQRLPDWMATNFGSGGAPGGWMEKPTATLLLLGFFFVLAILMSSLPWLVGKAPAALISIPNRERLLTPERRPETIGIVQQFFSAGAILSVAFFVFVNHLVIKANLLPEPRLSSVFVPMLLIYFSLLGVLVLRLITRLRRVE